MYHLILIQVVLDENGMSKGYGFVHFETQKSADMAIQKVNGMLLNEKKVWVMGCLTGHELTSAGLV